MIAEFTVENFYSICTKQTLSFIPTTDKTLLDEYTIEVKPDTRLLKLGVVYGANASGKTKLLEAVEFFSQLMVKYPDNKSSLIETVPFLLDNTSAMRPTMMQMTFYVDGEKYILSITFDQKRIYQESLIAYPSTRPATLYERKYDEATDSTRVIFGSLTGLSKKSQDIVIGNTLNNCPVIAAMGQSNVESSRLTKIYDYFNYRFSDSTLNPDLSLSYFIHQSLLNDKDGSLKRFIMHFLQASDFNIDDVILQNKGKELLFSHTTTDGKVTLPEEVESNGTMRFMGMITLLKSLLYDHQFIIIDEIETSLHYELLTYFLKVFLVNSTSTSQLLIATHDINLLDEDYLRRDTIWFTDKNEKGETQLVRLNSLGLHKNLSPYNAYRQGKLVNLPFTGNIYFNLEDYKEGK